MVENFGKRKLLAVQVSRDSLDTNDGRTSLPFPQQKNNTTLAQSMSSIMTRIKVFVMMGIIIVLLVGGIAVGLTYKFGSQDRDGFAADMTTQAAFGTTLATVVHSARII